MLVKLFQYSFIQQFTTSIQLDGDEVFQTNLPNKKRYLTIIYEPSPKTFTVGIKIPSTLVVTQSDNVIKFTVSD